MESSSYMLHKTILLQNPHQPTNKDVLLSGDSDIDELFLYENQ